MATRDVVVAVIPARGGSKGVPRKNVRPVGGVPLVGRAVLAARAARLVDHVFVSTDDAEIARVAEAHGGRVVQRPDDLSGDTASSESALLHALDRLAADGIAATTLVFLQCTSPFTRGEDIDRLIGAMRAAGAQSALSVAASHAFLWTIAADGTGRGVNHDPDRPRKRRQELEPEYRETGAIYVMDVAAFRAEGHRFCGRTVPVRVDIPEVEIDSEEDLAVCTAILEGQSGSQRPFAPPRPVRLLVTDFDGVHTEDTVHVDETGREAVTCSRSDGLGVGRLRAAGVETLILSKERNPVVSARAAKLKCPVLQGIDDKVPALRAFLAERGIDPAEIVYVGNDVNDLGCLGLAGVAAAPSDARPEVLAVAGYVTRARGGRGAVREVCEAILAGPHAPTAGA